MPKITVDPEVLEKKAGEISRLSERLSKLTGKISNVCLLAGSHDGQFKPRVVQLAGHMNSKIMMSSGRASRTGEELKKISNKFKAADSIGFVAMDISDKNNVPYWINDDTNFLSYYDKNFIESSLKFLGLGSLFIVMALRSMPISILIALIALKGYKPKPFTEDDAEKQVAKELKHFHNTKTGKEMIAAAISANVLFVFYDRNGNEVTSIGDSKTARRTVPITWRDAGSEMKHMSWGAAFSPGDRSIYLNRQFMKDKAEYGERLIHEMQHCIDRRWLEGEKFFTNQDFVNTDSLSEMSPDQIRDFIKSEVTSRIQSEVRAFDIGYEHGSLTQESKYGKVLNRHDGVFTKEEYEHVLITREYNNTYKHQWESILRDNFPDGPSYSVTISVDTKGEIQVDLEVYNIIDHANYENPRMV